MKFTLLTIALWLGTATATLAQVTYWIPVITETATERTYEYSIQLPAFMNPWIEKKTAMNGGEVLNVTSQGQPRVLVKQYFAWEVTAHGPAQGKIAYLTPKGVENNGWENNAELSSAAAVIAGLNALAKPYGSDGKWRQVELLALRQEGDAVAGLTWVEDFAVPGQAGSTTGITYWLPTITETPTERIYDYNVQAPVFMNPWIEAKTGKGGATVPATIDGRSYTLVKQYFGWNAVNSGPEQGQIAYWDDGIGKNGWMTNTGLAANPVLRATLDALAARQGALDSWRPGQGQDDWRRAEVIALRQEGANPVRGLRYIEPIPVTDQIKARMRDLAQSTQPGKYFPNETLMPLDIDTFRREVVAWGNEARKDPDFRAKNKYAVDLRGATVTGEKGPEPIFRHSDTPPFFNDLVLYEPLNEACQYMAEYYAKTNGNEHQPPGGPKHEAKGQRYNGADMESLGARLAYFAPGSFGAEGLAGAGAPDEAPENWMRTDTHYRPWFNIAFDVKAIGIGVARTDKGWYFCKIGAEVIPENAVLTPATGGSVPTAPTAPVTPAPVVPQVATPAPAALQASLLAPGTDMTPGEFLYSADGSHFLTLNPDGNLVIARADMSYVWGFDTQNVPYQEVARVSWQADGNLAAYAADGRWIWSALNENPDPAARLVLQSDGALQIISDSRGVLWSSSGNP